jgi:hypothetical protein
MRANVGNTLVPNTFYRFPISIMLGLTVLSWSQIADATLVDEGKTTFDTETGQTWLDLTETQQADGSPILLPDLKDELGAGGLFEGYRIATWPEVHTFMSNAGVQNSTTTGPTAFTADDVAAGTAWSALIDETLVVSYGANLFGSRGYVEVLDPTKVPGYSERPHPDNMLLVGYYLEGPGGPISSWSQWTNDFWQGLGHCNCIIPGAGWWLVRGAGSVDIKPNDDRNRINLCAKGDLSVAIFSSETFDATDLDPITIVLAGAGVKTDKHELPVTRAKDVNKDGLTDLIAKFVTEDLGLDSGDTEAWLQGSTFGGVYFEGKDAVKVKQQMCVRTLE